MFKTCGVVCAAMALAACGAPNPRQTLPHGSAAAASNAQPPAGLVAYHIDSAQSEIRLLVQRAGPMARLGHNHVIVNRAVRGWVALADTAPAAFVLTVPVEDFVVDDARARSEEGPDFRDEVAEDAKSGTRRNMLSAAVLDADHFPTITLASVAATPPGTLTATLAVNVAGHESTLVVPFALQSAAGRITASGTVMLRQSAMGLTPLSVMLGALQVQDELTVKFTLVAVAS